MCLDAPRLSCPPHSSASAPLIFFSCPRCIPTGISPEHTRGQTSLVQLPSTRCRGLEAYSIVTEYTSFLVLENDAEYQRWDIERKNLLRTGRDRKQQQLVRNRLETLREEALADLAPKQEIAKPQVANRPSLPKPVDQVATRNTPAPAPPRTTGRDLDFTSRSRSPSFGGGGGAFDPITGVIALGLAGLGAASRRKRRPTSRKNKD